jgi:membrane-bound serine protease (ClpP class)
VIRPRGLIFVLLLLLGLALAGQASGPAPKGEIYIIPAQGSINPGLGDFILEGIRTAENRHAEALVILLDTPGGLDSTMRQIVQGIINAKMPVIVYVSPKGARAASAGVLITLAAHVAAMAPGTNIGAAHPVSMGMREMDKVMGQKVVNDMVAYGQALAAERGRNAAWVEKAVRQSVSITASEALRLQVIDLVAESVSDLLQKVNGRTVTLAGQARVLNTAGAPVREIAEGLRTRVLKYIGDPNVAYILMMLGLAGLYFELAHPGVVLPGVVGVLCLLLAFFSFQTLPINYIGILLIILAFVLFILEFKVTSYGLLSLSGILSLLLGSMMLFRGEEGMGVSWGVLIPTVIIISAFFIAVAGIVFKSHLRRAMTGAEAMVGEKGHAYTDLAPRGKVFVQGEYWQAESEEPIWKGEPVEVVKVVNLRLLVRRSPS